MHTFRSPERCPTYADRLPAEIIDEKRTTVRIALNPYGLRLLGTMLFTARSLTKLRLQVRIPEERRTTLYGIV